MEKFITIFLLGSLMSLVSCQNCPAGWQPGSRPAVDGFKCFRVFDRPVLPLADAETFCESQATPNNPQGKLLEIKNLQIVPQGFFPEHQVRLNAKAAVAVKGKYSNNLGIVIPDTDFTFQGLIVPTSDDRDQTLSHANGVVDNTISTGNKISFACQINAGAGNPGPGNPGPGPQGQILNPGETAVLGPNECVTIQSHAGYPIGNYGVNSLRRWDFRHLAGSQCRSLTITFDQFPFDIPSIGGSPDCRSDVFFFQSPTGSRKICGNAAPASFSTVNRNFYAIFYSDGLNTGAGARARVCATGC